MKSQYFTIADTASLSNILLFSLASSQKIQHDGSIHRNDS